MEYSRNLSRYADYNEASIERKCERNVNAWRWYCPNFKNERKSHCGRNSSIRERALGDGGKALTPEQERAFSLPTLIGAELR
jgi:hypothetical protein